MRKTLLHFLIIIIGSFQLQAQVTKEFDRVIDGRIVNVALSNDNKFFAAASIIFEKKTSLIVNVYDIKGKSIKTEKIGLNNNIRKRLSRPQIKNIFKSPMGFTKNNRFVVLRISDSEYITVPLEGGGFTKFEQGNAPTGLDNGEVNRIVQKKEADLGAYNIFFSKGVNTIEILDKNSFKSYEKFSHTNRIGPYTINRGFVITTSQKTPKKIELFGWRVKLPKEPQVNQEDGSGGNTEEDTEEDTPEKPTMELKSLLETDKSSYEMEVCIHSTKKVGSVKFSTQVPTRSSNIVKPIRNNCGRKTLQLQSGKNKIIAEAYEEDNTTILMKKTFIVTCDLKEKRYALVIGNTNYSSIDPLNNPVNDAIAISGELKKLGFEVDRKDDVSGGNFKLYLDNFKDKIVKNDYDAVLFYYAGHGFQEAGINYLMPVDIQPGDKMPFQSTNLKKIVSIMEKGKNPNQQNIIIIDACKKQIESSTTTIPKTRSWTQGFTETTETEIPEGFFIAFSTQPGKKALDGPGEHSIYAKSLLQNIGQSATHINTIFDEIKNEVVEGSENILPQKPWYINNLERDFYFKK